MWKSTGNLSSFTNEMLSIKVPYNDAKTNNGNVKYNEWEYMGEDRQEIYLHLLIWILLLLVQIGLKIIVQ